MERHELVALALHVVHLVTAARQLGVKRIRQQGNCIKRESEEHKLKYEVYGNRLEVACD